jgi:hypothetical protein
MKKNIILWLLIFSFSASAFIIGRNTAPKYEYHVQDIYFDGEGNVIPNEAVQLLVTSQFVKIEPEEKKELDNYFYNQTH